MSASFKSEMAEIYFYILIDYGLVLDTFICFSSSILLELIILYFYIREGNLDSNFKSVSF